MATTLADPAALTLGGSAAAPLPPAATKDSTDFDLRCLVDWASGPLSLSEVVDAVERVLQHPSATQARTAPVVRDILK